METTLEQKREAAKQYLDQLGINRALPNCKHVYDPTRHVAPPRFDVSPNSKLRKVSGDE